MASTSYFFHPQFLPLRGYFLLWLLAHILSTNSWAASPQVSQLLKSSFERTTGTEPGGAALYPDSASSWYDHSVVSPSVHYDGKLYRLWFVGLSRTQDPQIPYGFAERIGMATSGDGIHWKVANQGQPVFDYGPTGSFDACGVTHPFVLYHAGRFLMWYGGIDGRSGQDIGDGPAHVRVEQIGLATSLDGIHWTRQNSGRPVMTVGQPGSIDSVQATGCHIIRRGLEFVMWYGAYNGTHTVGLATSSDGIDWKKGNQGASLPGLQGPQQLGPAVYFDGGLYLMYYNTLVQTANGGNLWKLFAATSRDGVRWKPALKHQSVLPPAPRDNFGSADGKKGNNHCVHPTKGIFLRDRVRVWYGAEGHLAAPGRTYAPSAIGLMEAILPAP